MTATLQQVHDLEEATTAAEVSYLKRFGWTCTCNTPGAFWLWQRDFADIDAERRTWWENTCASNPPLGNPSEPRPYGVMTVPADLAVRMTENTLDHDNDGRCRLCGCTDHTSCEAHKGDPGHWSEEDLCSHCADKADDE